MSEQHYKGSCQCGAIRFEADLDLATTYTCNCSRCQRLGSVFGFTPRSKFTLNSGEDSLSEYRFNTHQAQHQFCKICGIQPFAFSTGKDGTPMTGINVNCLDGLDPRSLTSIHADGRSF